MRIWLTAVFLLAPSLQAQQAEAARTVLKAAAADRSPDRRRETAVVLGLVPSHDPIVKTLEELMKDSDYQVRQAAIASLSEFGGKSKIPLLREALHDEVPEVFFAAARALWNLEDPQGREALLSIYASETKAKSNFFRGEARDVMRKMKTPKTAFLFAMQSGIGFVPIPGIGAGYQAVQQILFDPEFSARATSLILICRKYDGACKEALGSAFSDGDWSVRAAAVQTASSHRDARYKTKLAELFADKNDRVRLRAAATYLRIDYAAKRSAHVPSGR